MILRMLSRAGSCQLRSRSPCVELVLQAVPDDTSRVARSDKGLWLACAMRSPRIINGYLSESPSWRSEMSDEDLRAELERLKKENEALKKGASKGVSLKVSEKGGLSVY